MKTENTVDGQGYLNPLSRFSPEEPRLIPEKFTKPFKRSVYFPKGKGSLLYQATQIADLAGGLGINEVVTEALELWINKKRIDYIKLLKTKLERESQNTSRSSNKEDADKMRAALAHIHNELERYKYAPQERYEHFFYATLNTMADCGWPEMSGHVHATIEEDYRKDSAKLEEELYENTEAFEMEQQQESVYKRRRRNQRK